MTQAQTRPDRAVARFLRTPACVNQAAETQPWSFGSNPAHCMSGLGGLCSTISSGLCGACLSTKTLDRTRSAQARFTTLSISGSRAAKRRVPSSVSKTNPQKSPKRSWRSEFRIARIQMLRSTSCAYAADP